MNTGLVLFLVGVSVTIGVVIGFILSTFATALMRELERPPLLIPVGAYEVAVLHSVTKCEVLRVRAEDPPQARGVRPYPRGPQHRHGDALREPGRHLDHPITDVAAGDGFEELCDGVQVPVPA